jgi:hypothetical protein
LFIDAIFTDMGRFTFRALHFDFLHSYLYYATPKLNFNQLYHQVAQSSDLLFYRIAALAEGTGEQTADSIG